MELQAIVATLGQRTLAESRPTANQPGQEPNPGHTRAQEGGCRGALPVWNN